VNFLSSDIVPWNWNKGSDKVTEPDEVIDAVTSEGAVVPPELST
jgi:hypothetical protein